MRKKALKFAAALCAAVMLCGCGAENGARSEQQSSSDKSSLQTSSTSTAKPTESSTKSTDDSKPEESSQPEETQTVDLSVFEPLDEIKNAKPEDMMVQIGDVVIEYPATLPELIKKIEGSSLEWSHNYEPDKLVAYRDNVKVEFKLDGKTVFHVSAYNYSAEEKTITAKECVYFSVSPDSGFTYYFDGYRRDGKNVPKYTEYTKQLADKGIEYTEKSWSKDTISVGYHVVLGDYPVPSQGITMSNFTVSVYAYFDTSTSECNKFDVPSPAGYSWKKTN